MRHPDILCKRKRNESVPILASKSELGKQDLFYVVAGRQNKRGASFFSEPKSTCIDIHSVGPLQRCPRLAPPRLSFPCFSRTCRTGRTELAKPKRVFTSSLGSDSAFRSGIGSSHGKSVLPKSNFTSESVFGRAMLLAKHHLL